MYKIKQDSNRSSHSQVDHKTNVKASQVQILPEKTCREIYRITTFYNFSHETDVDPLLASSHGFFHTPSPYFIQCFSCSGKNSTKNQRCDDEWLRKIHKSTCDFANGNQTGNESIQELSPYDILPNTSLPPFESNSVAGLQHSYSSSSVASDVAGPSTPLPNSRNRVSPKVQSGNQAAHEIAEFCGPSLTTPSIPSNQLLQSHLQSLFPCEYPANSLMTSKRARLQTFLNSNSPWKPLSQLQATPNDFAEAGLYFLGDRDRVKCWYCNGGLQNWERNDDPWKEHTKWFPTCEFVLQQKGPEYVHKIVTSFPNLNRPIANSQTRNMGHYQRSPFENFRNQFEPSQWTLSSSGTSNSWGQNEGVVEIVDPQVEKRKREEVIEREMRRSEHVTQLKRLGFDEEQIKQALRRQLEGHNEVFNSLEDFLEVVLNLSNPSVQSRSRQNPYNSQPHHRSSEEERETVNSGRCKICLSSPANLVFLPCGHLVCCISCGNELESCLVCDSYIGEKIHSFTS